MKLLNDRVLLKRYSEKETDVKSGLTFSAEPDYLPKAEVVAVSQALQDAKDKVNVPKVGDRVYFVEPREKGKIKFNGDEHFAVRFGDLVSII
tara:strand:- start:16390 stop:16665 length:276 start_codon:yes stop_codon:yes gene_type:complete